MSIFIRITFLLTVSCYLWTTESRSYRSIISVTNGGDWGDWGKPEFCYKGYAKGFHLKVHREEGSQSDKTGLNAIGLRCTDGTFVQASYGEWGTWTKRKNCPRGSLNGFSLRVQRYQGRGDDSGATDIQFSCSDGSKLKGAGMTGGEFGEWSPTCPTRSYICGLQTKVEAKQWSGDDTGLNDVKFYCC